MRWPADLNPQGSVFDLFSLNNVIVVFWNVHSFPDDFWSLCWYKFIQLCEATKQFERTRGCLVMVRNFWKTLPQNSDFKTTVDLGKISDHPWRIFLRVTKHNSCQIWGKYSIHDRVGWFWMFKWFSDSLTHQLAGNPKQRKTRRWT